MATDDSPDVHDFDVTSEMFFQMIEAGVFSPQSRVFLWEGRLYEKKARTPVHATTTVRIQDALWHRVRPDWLIWPENPIALDSRHAPLPDVMLVRGPITVYERERRHPQVNDVGLIVEVAVTSLQKDLTVRAEKFARALVANYWVVNVQGHAIIEHRAPRIIDGVGSYASVETRGHGDQIHLVLGRVVAEISIADLIR